MALATAAPAAADRPRLEVKHADWSVYVRDLGGDRVCYALSDAVDATPLQVDHGRVVFMLATWRSGAARQQPSLQTGYQLRVGAPTRARVGSSRFKMFADGEDAFIEQAEDEQRLVAAMRRGFTMFVETVSDRGTATSYEFSLKGVTAALRAVDEACR